MPLAANLGLPWPGALASGLQYYPNQGKLGASIRGSCSITATPPFFSALFTLSSAIKSSLRNQFTARKTSSLQSVGVLGPLDRPCLASAITRSFIALGCKPVQVCLCATRTHIQGLRLFC